MEGQDETKLPKLELASVIGFQGRVRNGLLSHPDRYKIVYAVGNTVVIKDLTNSVLECLHGHTNTVSCLAMSKDGSLLASGQLNYMGHKAKIIVWDFKMRKEYGSHSIHKVKVEAVAFSCNGNYVVSLGGEDCRNIVIWDVKTREPLCGSPSAMFVGGYASRARCANLHNTMFVAAGRENLRLWKIDHSNRKISSIPIPVGQMKREFLCLEIDSKDEFLYCGTTSGDVLKVLLNLNGEAADGSESKPKLVCSLGKTLNKEIVGDSPLFTMGVTALVSMRTGGLIVGTGQGVVCRAEEKQVFANSNMNRRIVEHMPVKDKPIRIKAENRLGELVRAHVMGSVSMIALRGDGHQFFVGTTTCEIYRITLPDFACELLFTCHGAAVNAVAFPRGCHSLFVTCSFESVRVWNVATSQELLRVTVANMTCDAVCFSSDGRCILSGWNDGKIRAYTPESGRLIYAISDAHQRGVTAIAGTSDSLQILSGGGEGEVRIWDVNPNVQMLVATMKEHKGAVTSIRIKSNDIECVTSGADGSCIIWDLKRFLRSQVVFANTLFRGVCYGPNECQIITCGSDRKIGYWEVLDGSQIRELEGSSSGSINAMDISEDCDVFVSGGCDKIVKAWLYQEGVVTHTGCGHSDEITAICISPGMHTIISVSKDGSIFIWEYPNKN